MAVPKKKRSKSKCRSRDANKALSKVVLGFDLKGDICLPHRATKLPNGSYVYKGRVVVDAKRQKGDKAEA